MYSVIQKEKNVLKYQKVCFRIRGTRNPAPFFPPPPPIPTYTVIEWHYHTTYGDMWNILYSLQKTACLFSVFSISPQIIPSESAAHEMSQARNAPEFETPQWNPTASLGDPASNLVVWMLMWWIEATHNGDSADIGSAPIQPCNPGTRWTWVGGWRLCAQPGL